MNDLLRRLDEVIGKRKVDITWSRTGMASARDFEVLMRSDMRDLAEDTKSNVYVVADVEFVPSDESKPNKFRASGSLVRLAGYLAEHSPRMKSISYEIVTVTRDRNLARRAGTEV